MGRSFGVGCIPGIWDGNGRRTWSVAKARLSQESLRMSSPSTCTWVICRPQGKQQTAQETNIDVNAVSALHPAETSRVTTTTHEAFHAAGVLDGLSASETADAEDTPSSATGKAEEFGQLAKAEDADWSKREAKEGYFCSAFRYGDLNPERHEYLISLSPFAML